jgi:hypothetical protein
MLLVEHFDATVALPHHFFLAKHLPSLFLPLLPNRNALVMLLQLCLLLATVCVIGAHVAVMPLLIGVQIDVPSRGDISAITAVGNHGASVSNLPGEYLDFLLV